MQISVFTHFPQFFHPAQLMAGEQIEFQLLNAACRIINSPHIAPLDHTHSRPIHQLVLHSRECKSEIIGRIMNSVCIHQLNPRPSPNAESLLVCENMRNMRVVLIILAASLEQENTQKRGEGNANKKRFSLLSFSWLEGEMLSRCEDAGKRFVRGWMRGK